MSPVSTDEFTILWEAQYPAMLRVLRAMGLTHEQAEDACQEAALYLCTRLARLPQLTPAYLKWLAVQRAKNTYRNSRTQRRGGGGEISVGTSIELVTTLEEEREHEIDDI